MRSAASKACGSCADIGSACSMTATPNPANGAEIIRPNPQNSRWKSSITAASPFAKMPEKSKAMKGQRCRVECYRANEGAHNAAGVRNAALHDHTVCKCRMILPDCTYSIGT